MSAVNEYAGETNKLRTINCTQLRNKVCPPQPSLFTPFCSTKLVDSLSLCLSLFQSFSIFMRLFIDLFIAVADGAHNCLTSTCASCDLRSVSMLCRVVSRCSSVAVQQAARLKGQRDGGRVERRGSTYQAFINNKRI